MNGQDDNSDAQQALATFWQRQIDEVILTVKSSNGDGALRLISSVLIKKPRCMQ